MQLAKAQIVKKPAHASTIAASLYVALFFVIAAVAQLFAYEDFPGIITNYSLPLNDGYAPVIAASVVILEVFALPYLIWMNVSRLMRLVSMIAGWVMLFYWLGVGVWQSLVDFHIANAGMFGSKVMLPQGWWLVSYVVILMILLAYARWGENLTRRPNK